MKVRRIYLSFWALALLSLALGGSLAHAQAPAFTFTQLDVPGSASTEADGINAQRQIIGFFVDNAGKQHGFLHERSTFTTLDFPGAATTRTVSINDASVITGSFTDASGASHGLVGRAGAFTRFDFPGSTSTLGLSINNQGEIAGLFND